MWPYSVAAGTICHPGTVAVDGGALRHHVLHAQLNVASDRAAHVKSPCVPDVHVAKLSVHVTLVSLGRAYAALVRGVGVGAIRRG